ncbi:MAG TPA: mechanosensitive ion channel family protein [Tissierellaceae bacterium]|nr:mechanosensitive ion channel family protein [Tissierellaceae bacterium]
MENITGLIDNYLRNHDGDINIFGKLIVTVLVLVCVGVITKLINRIIDRTLRIEYDNVKVNKKRTHTLASSLKKVIKYILLFIGAIIILELFGINTTSILATAGIGGLAIGFGAQSLVKDVITGFFILVEDQYSVGDYIQISDMYGIVEELDLRVTKLRAFSGELYIIPNSSISVVTNYNRGAMRALVIISISNEENIDRAIEVLKDALSVLEDDELVVDGPYVLGVSDIGEYHVDIRIVAYVKNMEQWGIERKMRKIATEALQKSNIKRAHPKREIVGGDIE